MSDGEKKAIPQAQAEFTQKILEEMKQNGFLNGFMAGSCLMLARQGDFLSAAYGYRVLMRDNSVAGNEMFERLRRMFNAEETEKLLEAVQIYDSNEVANV